MSKTLISIDPGKSSGVSVGTYSNSEPYKLTHAFQIEGGVEGFLKRVTHYQITDDFSGSYGETIFEVEIPNGKALEGFTHWYGDVFEEEYNSDTTFLVEKFTARGQGNAFSYRTEALEPLRVEGAILALGIDPTWVSPQHMYFMSGESKNPTTNAHRWLKEHGLHITGKDVGCKDSNDARSAILHSIAWLRRQGHKPTLKHYFPEGE